MVFTKWRPNYKIFTNTFRIFFVWKYKQTEEITKNKKFLKSLKEYVSIFSKRFEQLFNLANSIIFAKSIICSKHPDKIWIYSLTNFKNFLFVFIFAISLLLARKNSQYPRNYGSIFNILNFFGVFWAIFWFCKNYAICKIEKLLETFWKNSDVFFEWF